MQAVDIVGIQLEPTSGAAFVLLRERDEPHRVVPIVVGGLEATAIALAFEDREPPRPLTFDLMATLVAQLEGSVDRVEVTALHDGTFFAELTVTANDGVHQIDTRPSDAIALAVRTRAPLYVSPAVLDEVGATLDELVGEESPSEPAPLGEEHIDAQVDEFRVLLEGLDPDDFADPAAQAAAGQAPATDHDAESTDPDGSSATGTATSEPAPAEPVDPRDDDTSS